MLRKFVPITTLLFATLITLPALADIILPGMCHMGLCLGFKFLEKTLLEDLGNEKFYAVELQTVVISAESGTPPTFEPETSYVLCSTTRPTFAFLNSDNEYIVRRLNPGLDYSQYSAATEDHYPIYWVTCHNFVGPDFFSTEMTRRARQLGYPLTLRENTLHLNNPRDILTR